METLLVATLLDCATSKVNWQANRNDAHVCENLQAIDQALRSLDEDSGALILVWAKCFRVRLPE